MRALREGDVVLNMKVEPEDRARMTIDVVKPCQRVQCCWFDDNQNYQRQEFDVKDLELAPPEDEELVADEHLPITSLTVDDPPVDFDGNPIEAEEPASFSSPGRGGEDEMFMGDTPSAGFSTP